MDSPERPAWKPPAGRAILPRRLRVRNRRDFQRAFRDGSRARGDTLIVVAVPNDLPHPRLGLSVGKRVWKSAVRRNRVRRVFREAFRLEREALPEGFDLVLIPAVARLEPELAATRAELVRVARKAAARARERLADGAESPRRGR